MGGEPVTAEISAGEGFTADWNRKTNEDPRKNLYAE